MRSGPPSHLGPYQILGPLGAGGMGEVYRAKDVRLQREVAVKILPESAASNPDRHRRFAQEAIAAGALNHPNILIVHDVGVEGDIPYLVSELVDGHSLGQETLRGRMPLKRLLDVALQIADGLRAAHDAGIVHRDLKPDNVMVTRDDRVKILDFGIAKVLGREDDEVARAFASTETAAGLLLGTVDYMSPEQARGGRLDFRTDQFSLGVILTELVTGAHPFRRETGAQTLAAIIDDEAPDLAQATPAVPMPLKWIIERLLAKEPRDRYAHTADLVADLRTLRGRMSETAVGFAAPIAAASRGRRVRWVVAALVLALGAFAMGRLLTPAGTDLTRYRFTPWANDAGYQGAPAFSPDGRAIAYVAEVDGVLQIFTRSLASPTRLQLTHSRFDCHDPFWAPDGTRIFYHSLAGYNEALWEVSLAGGPARKVIDLAGRAAISPDGRTLALLRDEPERPLYYTLWFSSPPGAEPKKYAMPPLGDFVFDDGYLRFSPDGSKLLMWLMRDDPAGESEATQTGFWMVPMPDGTPQLVMPSLAGLRAPPLFSWFPDNRHLAIARSDERTPGNHLWIADMTTDTARPLTITNLSEGSPAVSPDGETVAFTSEATDFDLALVAIDGSGVRPLLSSTRNELDPAWSPVRNEYVYVTDRSGTQEIWLRSADGDLGRPLVTDADFDGSPTIAFGALAFSPDGQRLAYQRFSAEGYRIWISAMAGGAPVQLGSGGWEDAPSWSPDGEWIAYITGKPPGDLAKTRVGAGATTPVVLKSKVQLFARPRWSPDGRWILCQAPEGLTLVAADGQTTRIIDEDDWLVYDWAPNSIMVYGLQATEDLHHLMLASVNVATGQRRVVNPNLGAIPQANQPLRGFNRVGPRDFALSIARVRSDIWLLQGFKPVTSVWSRLWPFAGAGNQGGGPR